MITVSYNGKSPRVAASALVADTACLIGDVEVGEECTIWPGVVIRADTTAIRIGSNVHIEDNSVLHTATHIEDDVMIGHNCTIEGFIGRGTLIGNTASLMPYSRVGAGSAVAAGAIVLDGTEIPAGSFAVGVPARVHSAIDPGDPAHRMRTAAPYIDGMRKLAAEYQSQGIWARP